MELNIDNLIQTAAEIAIRVLLPVLLVMIVDLLRRTAAVTNKYIANLAAGIDEKHHGMIKMLVSELVWAADQYDIANHVRRAGEEKKQWVIERIAFEASRLGINIDISLLADMIEAEVARMNMEGTEIILPDVFEPVPPPAGSVG